MSPLHAPVKLLLVDDLPENLVALQALLQRDGLECHCANSGEEALELLLVHDYALALLDVQMPGMDGFELAELMRGSKRTSQIPILFLTAAGQDSQRAFRGYATGAVDFLFKPVDARVLSAKVDVFVQLAQQKQLLSEQLETAQQLLKTNEMLMAVLAHDLRTPLSAIIASASFLGRFGGEEKLKPATDRIARSSQRMARMVDQLLHVARLHGGRVSLMPQASDLGAICAAIVDECQVSRGPLQLALELAGDTRATIDPDLIAQVVQNLVGNALQHGDPEAPVTVRVDGTDRDSVTVTVSNGGAIDAHLLPHIFDAFHSGMGTTATASASNPEGLGLGLYIARELAMLHGGTVVAESSPEERTTMFSVKLPRECCQAQRAIQAAR